MALVGPKVPPAKFFLPMFGLRLICNVPRGGGGALASNLVLMNSGVLTPVPNGHVGRSFISLASLVDADSPDLRLLPSAASSLLLPPLAIPKAQWVSLTSFLFVFSIAQVLFSFAPTVGGLEWPSFSLVRGQLVRWLVLA